MFRKVQACRRHGLITAERIAPALPWVSGTVNRRATSRSGPRSARSSKSLLLYRGRVRDARLCIGFTVFYACRWKIATVFRAASERPLCPIERPRQSEPRTASFHTSVGIIKFYCPSPSGTIYEYCVRYKGITDCPEITTDLWFQDFHAVWHRLTIKWIISASYGWL